MVDSGISHILLLWITEKKQHHPLQMALERDPGFSFKQIQNTNKVTAIHLTLLAALLSVSQGFCPVFCWPEF